MNRFKISRSVHFLFVLLISGSIASTTNEDSTRWNKIVKEQYTLYYTDIDRDKIEGLDKNLQSGLKYSGDFFQHSFSTKFDVHIFPDRALLDKQWQKEWGDPTFKSQCWMIASGVATGSIYFH